MKRLFSLLVLLMAVLCMNAQTVTLTFTGMAKGGVKTEEEYQQIDSILVVNQTRDWSQMIYYPDTVLIMDVLDVPMIDVLGSGLAQNVPNPFDCVTEVNLNLSENDNVDMQVLDANGRAYAEYHGALSAGSHRFEITLAVPQTYFLTASTSKGKYSVKMVNLGSCGVNKMTLKSSADVDVISKTLVENDFDLGDEMKYLAYTTYNGIAFADSIVKQQNESEDITIHFNIPFCIYTMNIDYVRACESFTWDANGETFFETIHNGPYVTLQSAGGCDSVVMLDLTIGEPVSTEVSLSACQPITWNGIYCAQNGDYTAALRTITNCDSLVTLHFTRINNVTSEFSVSDCGPYTWNGETYSVTGDYNQTFQGQYGCDSIVTLHYTNLSKYVVDSVVACTQYTWNGTTYYVSDTATRVFQMANGCDSVVHLKLTIGQPSDSIVVRHSCGPFVYNGETYTRSGEYSQNLTTVLGCDSLITLRLTVTSEVEEDIYEVACESFDFNGNTYRQSGDYTEHFSVNSGSCDSIVHLHLEILHHTYSDATVTACDSYAWHGHVYTESGIYYDTLRNTQGCDSVCSLHLTINRHVENEKTIYACDRFELGDSIIVTSGDYHRTYVAANGCDSIVTYHIFIKHNEQTDFTQYACGSFTWNGETYTESRDYVQHFPSIAGCDSAVTMHLFIGSPDAITDTQEACGSYEWEGRNYTTSGIYQKHLQNKYGCDSLVTLNLTIYPNYSGITDSRTECDSLEWEGDVYRASGAYTKTLHTIHGCDSVVTLNLTIKNSVNFEFSRESCGPYLWDGTEYSSTGDHIRRYQAHNGCDSVVTLHLVYHEKVVDSRDGNIYCTMEYGNQVWMTENMKYLPQVDITRSTSDPRYYVYGYVVPNGSQPDVAVARNTTEYQIYGTLYNFFAAQTACPEGWHLPTRAEWNELGNYLRTQSEYVCNNVSENVAKAMASDQYWTASTATCAVGNNQSSNNTSEFNGLPAGSLNSTSTNISSGAFTSVGVEANWWTATQSGSNGYAFQLKNSSPKVTNSTYVKHRGYSVRCVKNTPAGN